MIKIKSNTDQELLAQLKKGDKRVLKELYHLYWQPLFVSAYNVLKDKETCEDLIQEVFTSLWKNREKIEIHISIRSYLYACVRYQVFRQIKLKNKLTKVPLFENIDQRLNYSSPETKMMHKELITQINAIVDAMPEKCKQVFQLSRYEMLSHKEIASKLNISTKTVENHITKALKIIKLNMGNQLTMEVVIFISFMLS